MLQIQEVKELKVNKVAKRKMLPKIAKRPLLLKMMVKQKALLSLPVL